ncbi:MAG: arsenic resistance N-acetyltransferase ArsN2 [Flavisolibacter sp.]
MQIERTDDLNRGDIIRLLKANNLPTEDLPVSLADYFSAVDKNHVIGVIGLECYGQFGLLRSLVVDADYRNRQIADGLVKKLENEAVFLGLKTLFLLTETANRYFGRRGYAIISRDEVPFEVRQSSEFTHVCPVSAIIMKKQIGSYE